MSVEQKVAEHYSHGSLEETILGRLRDSGKDIEKLTTADLSGVDEFHLGWHAATVALGEDLKLSRDTRVLDVGSGIGGPARYFAETHGCQVIGVDLTAEFVNVANALTVRCGLSDLATFRQGSALDLDFAKAEFEAATLIHVGMNIDDKERLFSEVRRVLNNGGVFGVYDVMRTGDGDLPYPMPWAMTAETSFVETIEVYKQLLADAGFALQSEISRRDLVLDLARRMREDAEAKGAPPLGLSVLMGPAGRERMGNVLSSVQAGLIAPVQLIVRAI